MSDTPEPPPTEPLTAGPQTLGGGRYEVHRRLGAGGMGLVLQATDTRLHREVAIKLLADNLAADETARERFLREARAAASLSDPHIVQVHDVDERDGRPYLVMELVDGPSLGDVLATQGPLDPHDVMEVAADALAGIANAHGRDLLHRDIKPGNLLRAPNGLIKVTDFGVAHAGDGPQLTRTGMVIGTAPYLAPERAAGAQATVRTDLYALGATLVELLTGRPPDGEDPADLDLEVPAALGHLLDRLLARDPEQRPASAEAALALLAGEVTTPRITPPSAGPRTPPPVPADSAEAATAPYGDVAAGAPSTDAEAGSATGSEARSDDADGPATGEDATGGDATGEDATAAFEAEPGRDDGERPGQRSPAVSWGLVVGIAVALLLVAVLFQGLQGDGSEAPAGVERVDDPAETARNLADWLRERAGE